MFFGLWKFAIASFICLIPIAGLSYDPKHLARLKKTNRCPGCDLRGAILSDANLRGADLRGADLSGATMKKVDLKGAKLSLANFSRVDLRGADLTGAEIRNANFHWALFYRARWVDGQTCQRGSFGTIGTCVK